MMAGRRGRPSLSTRITPCIWPESPSDVTSAPSRPTAAPVASRTAAHQSSGVDSAHPGRGARTAYEAEPSPRTAPPSAISSALTELVPRSRPRSIGETYPCLWDERFSFIRAHHVLFPLARRKASPSRTRASGSPTTSRHSAVAPMSASFTAPKAGPPSSESAIISPPFSVPRPLLGYITAPTAHWRRDCASYCGFIAPYSPLSVAYVLTSLSTAR